MARLQQVPVAQVAFGNRRHVEGSQQGLSQLSFKPQSHSSPYAHKIKNVVLTCIFQPCISNAIIISRAMLRESSLDPRVMLLTNLF